MSTRTEKQRAVFVAERSVIGVGGDGIGAGFLFRETDVVFHAELLSIEFSLLGNLLFEELQMIVADREMHVCLTIRAGIEGSLNEMFLHRCARTFFIVVEEQQALGKLSVVQSFLHQHLTGDSLVIACVQQGAYFLSFVCLAFLAKSLTEGELLDMLEEMLLEIGGGNIVGSIHKGEHILEHSAGSTTCRHELHNLVSFLLVLVPSLDIVGAFFIRRCHDAFSDGGGSFQLQERESRFELFQLMVHLLLSDSSSGDLF